MANCEFFFPAFAGVLPSPSVDQGNSMKPMERCESCHMKTLLYSTTTLLLHITGTWLQGPSPEVHRANIWIQLNSTEWSWLGAWNTYQLPQNKNKKLKKRTPSFQTFLFFMNLIEEGFSKHSKLKLLVIIVAYCSTSTATERLKCYSFTFPTHILPSTWGI